MGVKSFNVVWRLKILFDRTVKIVEGSQIISHKTTNRRVMVNFQDLGIDMNEVIGK